MYKEYLALNNLQWLICYKTNPTQIIHIQYICINITYNGRYAIKPNQPNHIYLIYMYKEYLALNNLQWLICYKTNPTQIIHIQYLCINIT